MERGDLAISVRPRVVVVLEGVLATFTPITRKRFRREHTTGFNISWHPTPLKRIATMKRMFPDVAIDVVTFVDGIVDDAAEFFNNAEIPVDSIEYHRFDKWVAVLPYQAEIQVIHDSDDTRLDQYGQLGRATLLGGDL